MNPQDAAKTRRKAAQIAPTSAGTGCEAVTGANVDLQRVTGAENRADKPVLGMAREWSKR